MPLASCLLPLASCLLPLAYSLFPIPYSLFPVPYFARSLVYNQITQPPSANVFPNSNQYPPARNPRSCLPKRLGLHARTPNGQQK
ncbi:MAG: hypothetical protein F6K56_30925 [Moorea sp. SIO3G5]|nr:hypothetical protein [Moorena sp. SIO3G5]